MTYTPTDEQIEALAQGEMSRDSWRELSQQIRSLTIDRKRRELARPAFQAIIRAAQAEAFELGTTHGIAFQAGNDGALYNPYRQEQDDD